ncbi:MAG TPA: aldehyde dehydrogenase family protein, partial [Puia sp.]|nr:aldehyde dehydrogenase family protein [Puia sp.]
MSRSQAIFMEFLQQLHIGSENAGTSTGVEWLPSTAPAFESFSPVDGKRIAAVTATDKAGYEAVVAAAQKAFTEWRQWPAPRRGEVVRQIGEALRRDKELLGRLVSYEMGKSLQEGYGEVQEMIDICDLAVGLSRQLNGLTMHSERPSHRMYEQWHPLGVVGIISAFNFPVAVWSWNAMIAWVCGNTCIWKPSEKTPLCALACQHIVTAVFTANQVPEGVSGIISGGRDTGEWMASDPRIPLISATGSTRMGKAVGTAVAARLGKSILELGGNNAIVITADADLNIAVPGAIFGAVGTAGQRCTSTRRLIIHEEIYDKLKDKLKAAYGQLRIGDPLDENNHVGPLIDKDAVRLYLSAIDQAKKQGCRFLVEGEVLGGDGYESGCYVRPCIAEAEPGYPIVAQETFAPVLYLL